MSITPGPWKKVTRKYEAITDANGNVIIYGDHDSNLTFNNDDDERAVLALPDLLAACELASEALAMDKDLKWVNKIVDAAIAKARGAK